MGPNGGYVPFTRLMVQSYGQCLGKVSTFFFSSTIFEFLVLGRNFMWTWFNIWWRKSINKKCISSCGNFHENFCSNEQRLHALRPSYTIEISVLGMFLRGFHTPRPRVMVFQNANSLYVNPVMDYVKQNKIIQWWQDFLEMKWHWKQPC